MLNIKSIFGNHHYPLYQLGNKRVCIQSYVLALIIYFWSKISKLFIHLST